ncbi:MAG TPA: YbjN domain-containing protein [Beijerinckiaceae bacterium]|nr:YbjN domain-containing protein [Beijerinckiaceae bacterium]
MELTPVETERAEHPVDVVEQMAALNEWTFDRDDDDEISISVKGGWTDYHVAFTWLPAVEALHVGCAFDIKAPARRRAEVLNLVSLVNEQLWVGHFGFWNSEKLMMFRHSLLLAGGAEPSRRQCEAALNSAIAACERYYQAFQFVLWAGKGAREALDSAMFETAGEA